MNASPQDGSNKLHSGTYHYRKWSVLIVGGVLFLVSAAVVVMMIVAAGREPWRWWEAALAVLFPGSVPVVMGYCGGVLVVYFLRRKSLTFYITDHGIHDRSGFTAWEDVGMIGIEAAGRRYWLWYQKRGRFALQRGMMQDPNLSRDEAERIVMRLREALNDRYPHLCWM